MSINSAPTSAVAAEIQINFSARHCQSREWKNKQTGEVPLTHCIPISWLQPGSGCQQVPLAEQCSEEHGPGRPESFPFLGIQGPCLQWSPEMLHPPEAAPWLCTKAVSLRCLWPSHPSSAQGLPLPLLAKLPEARPWYGSYCTAGYRAREMDRQPEAHTHNPRSSSTERGLCSKV